MAARESQLSNTAGLVLYTQRHGPQATVVSATQIIAYCDGASRGNPGPASIGAVLYNEEGGAPLREISTTIGNATNNVAEYKSLIAALEAARDLSAGNVTVYMDSELVVKQIKGIYRVKNAGLQPLHKQARTLLGEFPLWNVAHVPRARNAAADALANQALDAL